MSVTSFPTLRLKLAPTPTLKVRLSLPQALVMRFLPAVPGFNAAAAAALVTNKVTGPASSTDNAIVRWDGITGKLVQNSGCIIDDTNNVIIPGNLRIGTPSTSTGQLALANASNSFLTTIQAGTAIAARTYTWPTDFGGVGSVLTDAAGNGLLTWAPPVPGFTVEDAQDAVGNILVDSLRIDLTYNDATPSITADLIAGSITNNYLADVPSPSFKGRITVGSGPPEDLTGVQVLAVIEATTPLLTEAEAAAQYQPLDVDLTALATLATTGLLVRTGSGTAATRLIIAPAAGITISNNDGVAGNPTFTLANDLAALEALAGTNTIYYRSAADTWSPVTISTGLSFVGGVLTATSTSTGDVTGPASSKDNEIVRFDGLTGKIIQNGTDVFITDASQLLIGHPTAQSTWSAGAFAPALQVMGTNGNTGSVAVARYASSGSPARLFLGQSRGASLGTMTIVNNGDDLGSIFFGGADGTNFINAALISASVDGAPGANDMPGALTFWTTADGEAAVTDRVTIDSLGDMTILAGRALKFAGSASGVVSVQPKAAAGTWTFTLPDSAGTVDYVLRTDGTGITSWVPMTGGAGVVDGDYGDIVVSGGATVWTIDTDVVDNTKLANMAQATVKGRAVAAGTGDPTDLTGAQVLAIIEATTPLLTEAEALALYVAGPVSSKDNEVVRFDGLTGKIIQDGTEVYITDASQLLVGSATAQATWSNGAFAPPFQVLGTTPNTASAGIARYNASGSPARLFLVGSRGATIGAMTVVNSGDDLGSIFFGGADGTNFVNAAAITASVDGTPGATDMPGRLAFLTTSDGTASVAERVQIDSLGDMTIFDGRSLKLTGSTSGVLTVKAQAVAGTWTLELPDSDGDANQFLRTNGSGVTSWVTGRIRLNTDTTFYVATTGNDVTGDGTIGNPWATPQHAYDQMFEFYDLGGNSVTVQLADGTYTFAGLHAVGVGENLTGGGHITFQGNLANSAAVVLSGPGGSVSSCFDIDQEGCFPGNFFIRNFTFTDWHVGVLLLSQAQVWVYNCIWGASVDNHIESSSPGAQIYMLGTDTINTSSFQKHLFPRFGGYVLYNAALTLTGSPTANDAFIVVGDGTISGGTSTCYWLPQSVTGTGQGDKFYNTGHLKIHDFDVPGTVAGATEYGGLTVDNIVPRSHWSPDPKLRWESDVGTLGDRKGLTCLNHASFGNQANVDPTLFGSSATSPVVSVVETVSGDMAPGTNLIQCAAFLAEYEVINTSVVPFHDGFVEAFYGDLIISSSSVGGIREAHGILATCNNRGQGVCQQLIGAQFISRNQAPLGTTLGMFGMGADVFVGVDGYTMPLMNDATGMGTALALIGDTSITIYIGCKVYTVDADDNATITGNTIGDLYGFYCEDMSISTGTGTLTVTGDRANFWSAGAGSQNYFQGTVSIGATGVHTGELKFLGTTGGTVTLKSLASFTSYTLTLPPDDGNSGEFLRTDGSGVLTWVAASGGTITINTTPISGGTSGNFLYNNAGTVGERTPTQTTAVLDLFSTVATTQGVVPGSNGLTTSFLRGDGTWATPSGSGAPASVQYVVLATDVVLTQERVLTAGAGLTLTDGGAGGNVTLDVGAGTGITVNANDVALTVPVTAILGGTGQTVYAVGDILYASTTTALSKLADVATGNALISGGVGVAPSWGKIDLAAHITGDLPYANLTQGTARSVLGVTGNATADNASIQSSATGQVLNSTATTVVWTATPTVTTLTVGNTGLVVGASTPFSDAAGVLTLQNIDALDPTTESTIEAAIDTLSNLTSVGTITTGVWNGTDIAFANIAQGTARSVLGVAGNATADLASIQSASAGQILNSTATAIAWTATPTLGASGTLGTLAFGNATSGTITLSPTTGTLGTVTQTMQAVTGTIYCTGGTDVVVADGGTGASTLTGLLQGNGTSAITGITNSSTVGEVLRVTGASTYAWGALNLGDTDAVTGDLPWSNLVQVSAISKLLGRGDSGAPGDIQEITLGTNLTMSGTTLNAGGGGSLTIGSSAISGGTPTRVLYVGTGPVLEQASAFTIVSNQPNVTAGNSYLYDGSQILAMSAFGVFVGPAGNFTMTGASNVAIGTLSFVANVNGSSCVAIGYQALQSNTTGDGNLALGTRAIRVALDCNNCVAIGADAMANAAGGIQNVAIGAQTLQANLATGDNNVALGFQALFFNETGTDNIAEGAEALQNNISGSFNLANGKASLKANTTGNHNCALGINSLKDTQTGHRNTSIGGATGQQLNGGSTNTCIGYASGVGLSTGSENIIIAPTPSFATQVTSGSHNIVIGFENFPASATADNQLTIGNFIYGTGLSGTGSTVSPGLIGLGIKAPTAVLHLAASTTTRANLRFDPTSAAAPSSPNNGDLWYDGTNLKFRDSSTTHTLVPPPAGGTLTVGTSAIASGTAGRVLYEAAGNVLGEASAFTIVSGQPNVTSGNSYLYNGTQIISGITALASYFIGPSGNFSMSGTDNLVFGESSLLAVTSGSGNVCIGRDAMQNTTTGTGNLAIGARALKTPTAASFNVAFGADAMGAATGGNNNVGIGSNTLNFCATNGDNNVALGFNALTVNTTGADNIAEGSQALSHNTTGSQNLANGASSMAANIDGNQNVGMGWFSLLSNLHGHRNTCLGARAGQSCLGSDNTCIGLYSGGTLDTGNENIIIAPSPSFSTVVTTGSHNIVIGYENRPASATADNQLVIGKLIYGTGLSGTGTTISTAKIGIGIKAPATELDVAGSITVGTALLPDANDGAVLGSSSLQFSDLFLASGAVVNFANGDVTFTHSSALMTWAGGKVAFAAPTTARANMLITAGTAPTSPADGDLWYDGANLKFRRGSNTDIISVNGTVTLVDGATPALDASTGNVFVLTATGNRTIAVPSNPTGGQRITIRHEASGGARTLALNTGAGGFRFGTDITALTATGSGLSDYIGCIYDATDSRWDVVAYIKGF